MNAPLPVPRFVPVRTAPGSRQKQRRAAAKFRNELCDLIALNGPIGARALAEMTCSKVPTVRDYLHEMLIKGVVQAVKVKGKACTGGGPVACLYSMAGEDVTADITAKQYTRHEYPRNEVIDPYALPAEFFAHNNNEGMTNE